MRSQFPVAQWRLLRNTLIYWERRRLSRRFHKTLLESGTFLQKKVKIGNFLRKSMSLGARTAITLQKQPYSAASSLNSNNFGKKQTKMEIFEKNCGKMQWAIAKPWIHLRQFQRWKDYWSSWNHFSGWDSDGGCCQRWCFTWHGQNIRATKTS